MTDTLEMRLFGPPRIRRAGLDVRFDTRKAPALLAYLAVTGREHGRDALAALLWPGLERGRARATLRRTLSVAAAAGPALRVATGTVGLDPALVGCDVVEFRALVAGDDPAGWARAAELAGDGFLAGFALRDSPAFEDWQLATADALRDQLSQTLGRLVDDAVARGDLTVALAHARRRTEVDPLSEPAHAGLIRVTAWSGDRPGALRLYRALVRVLDRELGVPPLPETFALHEAIRADALEPPPLAPSRPGYARADVPAVSGAAPSAAGSAGRAAGRRDHPSDDDGERPSRQARRTFPTDPVDGLAGRDGEVARLLAEWRAAGAGGGGGGGRVVGLVGEPGVGKTALARSVAARVADDGGTVLVVAGRAAEQSLAFAAASDLVRAALVVRPGSAGEPDEPLAALVGSGGAGASDVAGGRGIATPGDLHRVYEAARRVVESLGTTDLPALVAVDDAQLLDPASAALLAYVVRRRPARTLLLATWAAGAGGAPLPEAVLETGAVLTVPPLDQAAVGELLDGTAHDPAEVLERTRGIPLLVREVAASSATRSTPAGATAPGTGTPGTVRPDPAAAAGPAVSTTSSTAAAPVAEGIREMVAARLDAAPETTRQLVGAAAVVGTVADPELLRVAAGRDEVETVDGIEDAIARGLLVERADRGGYDLPHDLVRDAALARLSLARSRLLHGRVADALARRHGVDPIATPAGAVARHLAGAGRDDEAGAWFLTAAEESGRLFAHAEALAQLRAALALGHRPLDVHQAIGASLVRLGEYGEALVALDQAAALAEPDPQRQAEIEHAIAGVHDRLGEFALAEAHLAAARDLVGDGPELRLARVLADLALVRHRLGRHDDARATAEEAARHAEAAGDDAARAQAGNVLGVIASTAGGHDEAAAHLRDAAARARAVGDLDLLVAALNNLSHAQAEAGDGVAALATAREALALAERQGDRHRLAALHSHVADLLHAAGREDEALEQLKVSAAAFAEVHGSAARPEVWTLTEW